VVALVVSVVVIGLGGLCASAIVRPAAESIKESLDQRHVASFVVTKDQLPSDYKVWLDKPSSSVIICAQQDSDSNTISPADTLFALGLKRCRIRVFAKPDSTGTSITNFVISQAYLMPDDQAASKLLSVLGQLYTFQWLRKLAPQFDPASVGISSVSAPGLGPGALGLKFGSTGAPDTLWLYMWRRGNIVAIAGTMDSQGSVLKLALAIDNRGRG
jgi:hypothetical protein